MPVSGARDEYNGQGVAIAGLIIKNCSKYQKGLIVSKRNQQLYNRVTKKCFGYWFIALRERWGLTKDATAAAFEHNSPDTTLEEYRLDQANAF